jgi:hypothetical protein
MQPTHLALLVVLEQVLAACAAWVRTLRVVALQYMRPQLLAYPTAAAELTFCLILLALGTVPQKQQPPLLLLYVLLPFLHAPVGIVIACQEVLLRY